MRFGKIEYLNLLPFDVFMKGYKANSSFKMSCNYKKGYPAKLNKDFLFRRIDSGFISSIAGIYSHYKSNVCQAGIIAYREVWSVIVLDSKPQDDYQSATSNALCSVLNLKGEVLIGDRALKYHYDYLYSNKTKLPYKDMAKVWYDKTRLPFVFGRACFHSHGVFYKKLILDFNRKLGQGKYYKGIKIPHYILMPYVQKIGINKKFALSYLQHIYYTIGSKEQHALILFYRDLRLRGIKPPKRFYTKNTSVLQKV